LFIFISIFVENKVYFNLGILIGSKKQKKNQTKILEKTYPL